MREVIGFDCEGDRIAATLDHAEGRTGLLIVSGGNEIRIGAHRGMAFLAQRVAAAGYPVLRYDRRGIGDSEGENRGFLESADELAAVTQTFRQALPVERIVALGNCDAATALALFHQRAGIDALLLANPWVIETESDLPPPAAIRARYAERLRDPRQWIRLARGGVNIRKLVKGLARSANSPSKGNSLAIDMAAALASSDAPATILLADRDNTAIAFREAFQRPAFASVCARASIAIRETASHSFAREGDADWLFAKVIEALEAAQ
ncbi:hydrolase 1, exosortase A system-associated [Sphingomonas sp. AX6]|uniref:hydrolase 1, exosortase A system-associated n=1 Tax=Sphingomonas sp. AX6 TaxID=2653171 RepID=UPI0012F0DD9A|nr:hydrolase 1, exosortase A system-associated [Sphingomonas sp. AX6]VXC91884.1 Alpha/beta hydrolase [Sphingomonas sp. AX6]